MSEAPTKEITDTRKRMDQLGWEMILPGVYVQKRPSKPSDWIVSQETIGHLLARYGGLATQLNLVDGLNTPLDLETAGVQRTNGGER